jgi:predicted permease
MRLERLHTLRRDVALALRGLRRTPGFALAAILTLALGIGANVTMLGIVDRLLLRPPAHVRDPDTLKRVYFSSTEDGKEDTDPSSSYPLYLAVAEAMRAARGVAAYYTRETALGEGEQARAAEVSLVTANYFATLGVRPALGRDFRREEDVPPQGSAVAIISHELWQRDFGGDPDVLGKAVAISGRRFEIVGVAPQGFTGAELSRIDAWVPLSALASESLDQFVDVSWHQAGNLGFLRLVARVRAADEVTRAAAQASTGLRRALEARLSVARVDSARPRASLEPLLLERGPERSASARIAVWLAGMSAVVLCIACANVANLLLARAVRRRRESALRVALGAGRGRLVAQSLTEALALGVLGGLGAVAVAHWGGMLVRRLLVPDVAESAASADPRLLAAAAAVAVGAGLLTGIVPALHAGRADLSDALKSGAREGGGRRSAARNALVVAQAALSLVLLAGAGLFVRSLRSARAVDLGFAPEHVLSVSADLAGQGYAPAEALALTARLHERLARLPGVVSASVAITEPFNTSIGLDISLPGVDSAAMAGSMEPRVNAVTPEYFATMGTRVVRGRGIAAGDRRGAEPVAVVNETMARTLWPGRDAIGRCVILKEHDGKPCLTVVGVAQDVRWRELREPATMQMYLSLAQEFVKLPMRVVYVRTRGEPAAMVRAVRHEVRQVAPRVLVPDVEPLATNLEPEMRPWRVGATVFTAFGALALGLAALGLYAVVAYDAAQRTREMGVRLALGARGGDVLRLVIGYGVRVAAVGVALGVAVALAAGPWVGPLLFDTAPHDPVVLGGMSVLLLVVAAAAGAVPAWRATRVAPGTVLRAE